MVREQQGVRSLAALLREGHAAAAASVAAAVLTQIAQADSSSLEEMREAGSTKALTQLVTSGVAADASGARA